jgi:hypothetical protein
MPILFGITGHYLAFRIEPAKQFTSRVYVLVYSPHAISDEVHVCEISTDLKLTTQCKSEVFTAVTMKNVVFWDINPSSYLTGNTLRYGYRGQPVNAM